MSLKDRLEDLKRELGIRDVSIVPTKAVWPSFEKAARAWAVQNGLDPDEFAAWLRKKATEKEPEQERLPLSHAEASCPED